MSNALNNFIKELIVTGINNREVSYSIYKEKYGRDYAKSTFFKNCEILENGGVLTSEVRKNKKFFSINKSILKK